MSRYRESEILLLPIPALLVTPSVAAHLHWSRGPMDRTMASEAVGSGSIPLGTTTSRSLHLNKSWVNSPKEMGCAKKSNLH